MLLLRTISHNLQGTAGQILHEAKPCLCGRIYTKNVQHKPKTILKSIRVYSTQSEQHRQKAVIDTTTPKIVINKIGEADKEIKIESLYSKIEPYIKLSRWDRPIGVYLLYWPCTWSIALASLQGASLVSLETAALFLVGAGLMRGAGCTINDMWDRDIDAQVSRTRDRPLVTGAISPKQATWFLAGQLSAALFILTQLNCYSVVLGASSMALVVSYPLAKRFTNYPQLFLGATFNWGALLGYSALQGSVNWAVCLPLYAGAMAWTVIYDTIYAHQDKVDDARLGIMSTALTFGDKTRPALAATLALSTGCLALAGSMAGLEAPYYVALMLYTAHVGRQEAMVEGNAGQLKLASALIFSRNEAYVVQLYVQIYTLDTENPTDCSDKFKSNAWVGLLIFLGILAGGRKCYVEHWQTRAEAKQKAHSCFFS